MRGAKPSSIVRSKGDCPQIKVRGVHATYVKVHRSHRIVSVATIVAAGGNADGRREMLSMDIGLS